MAILRRAGLNPDHFDIPGRDRPQCQPGRVWDGTGRSLWLDGLERAGGMRPPAGFDLESLVREAVREAYRRRRANSYGAEDGATHCRHQRLRGGCDLCGD